MTARRLLAAGLAAGLLTACSATPAPNVKPFQPTIKGQVTKGGQPAAGRKVQLRSYVGGMEGLYENQAEAPVTEAVTDAEGRYTLDVPLDRVLADEMFGVSYDPVPEAPARRTQDTNPDEIRAFATPAIWLHAKAGLTAVVSFDVAWDTSATKPAFGGLVPAKPLPFDFAPCPGATVYDVTVVRGTLDAQGAEAFYDRTTTTRSRLTWTDPVAGTYVWQARAYLAPTGIPDVASFRVVAPAFSLTVAAPATNQSPSPPPAVSGSSPQPDPAAS